MSLIKSALCKEIKNRIEKARDKMKEKGYEALIIYGNNKVYGSLRYLSGYWPDRSGWASLSATESFLFDGAALFLPLKGEPTLLLEPGLLLAMEICTKKVLAAGFSADKENSLTPESLTRLITEADIRKMVGIETWTRFPAYLYIELKEKCPNIKLAPSTIIEELRMVKSPLEIEIMRKGAMIGDMAHEAVVNALKSNKIRTELDLIRIAERTMRDADPIYEDSCTNSPSYICSGFPVNGSLLHLPLHSKTIDKGDAVHWDIGMRYDGYAIDTSRNRVIGKPTELQLHANKTALLMFDEVLKIAKPGVKAFRLVETADQVARSEGFKLWDDFLGHGVGIEMHERPDLVIEETELKENMILAIEPRVSINDIYLLGKEDMVLITKNKGVSLNEFENEPLEL